MKSKFLVPTLTAALGFTLAWIAKPGGPAVTHVVKTEESSEKRPDRPAADSRPSPNDSKHPKEVRAGDFPLADQADLGPKTRDEARMLRLTEALGLSITQQGDIIKLVEDAQSKIDGDVPVIQDLATRGKMIEDGLAKTLTPEQLVKFQELRARERDSLIQERSWKVLSQAISDIDMSPEQREDVLKRLREKTKADLQSIPASAALLFDKSMLPTNGKELSVDGILLLAKMGEVPQNADDPMAAHKKVVADQRGELEEILRCFDGILTPGQMGQYQAALSETREILKRMPQKVTEPDPEEEKSAKRPPAPNLQPEEVPDDDSQAAPEEP